LLHQVKPLKLYNDEERNDFSVSVRSFRTVYVFPQFLAGFVQKLLSAQWGCAVAGLVLQPFAGDFRHPFADPSPPSCTGGFLSVGFSFPGSAFCQAAVSLLGGVGRCAVPPCWAAINRSTASVPPRKKKEASAMQSADI